MPTYYKYAERNADSQVNWAEIGQGVTDMLKEETNIRIQKKAAIDESTRQFQNTLAAAPQGQFQDGNKFTNNFAHDMMAQQLIDTRLLKSGQMKLQDFTLRRQNYIDGTNQLFDLQKLYQDNYKITMDGLNSGELQAMTGANMGSVEGFADFSKSKAIINPYTGNINVGIMKPNPETGVMELTKDVVPVNVIKGKILTKIATFKVDDAMNDTVKTLGKDIDYIYKAATISGAGTITNLLGKGGKAFEDLKKEHPEIKNFGDYKESIDSANSALEKTMDGYFSDPYHISSVLTQNTGKYHQDSYIFDEKLAAKDPSKILLKINPNTGVPTLDENGPHYKDQVNEARDWVRTQLLSKLDKERTLTVTPQTRIEERRAKTDAEFGNERAQASAKVLGEKIAHITTGTPEQVQAALDYFDSIPGVKTKKTKDSITVYSTNKEGDSVTNTYDLTKDGKFVNPSDVGKSLGKLYNVDKLPEDILGKYIDQFTSGKKVNTITEATGGKTTTIEKVIPDIKITPDIFSIKSEKSSERLRGILPSGFNVEEQTGTLGLSNDVKVTAPNGKTYTYNANDASKAASQKISLEEFIKNNKGTTTNAGTVTGGVIR